MRETSSHLLRLVWHKAGYMRRPERIEFAANGMLV